MSSNLLERRLRVLGEHAPLFYDEPLHLVRGEGVWLFDAEGKPYLDAYNNVPHVGHCHPRVVEAMARQAAILNTHTRYLHESIVAYAELLTAQFDPSLSRVMFCCTGSESNELALRIARHCTQGEGIIVSSHSYHGNTAATIAASSWFTPVEGRGPLIRTVRIIDTYREPNTSPHEAARLQAAAVEEAIGSFASAGIRLAGLLYCSAFAHEGLPQLAPGFLTPALELVRRAGGLFICDEVQAGFGRFGAAMWGHQRLAAVPDIVTLGKPMGNGYPLAGVVARPDLVARFTTDHMYFNTFAGGPVAAAAGSAVLGVLADEGLLENARRVGRYLVEGLRRLQSRYALLGDIRGEGLMIAAELVHDREQRTPAPELARRVINEMARRRVLISRVGPYDNLLKIRPPLPFSVANADQFLDTLQDVLAAVQ